MIIQVVGLPCSGKSIAIKELQKKHSFFYVDKFYLSNFITGQDLEALVKINNFENSIIESACGYEIPNSKVILLKVPNQKLKKNKNKRGYISNDESLSDEIIPANYTVYSLTDLKKTIATLLRG